MWNDPRIWIPILTALITSTTTFLWQYLGNQEFRKIINKGSSWLRAKLLKDYFFWSVYVPVLLLSIAVLYKASVLNTTSALVAYSTWITIWCIHISKKNRNVSTIVSCNFGDDRSEQGHDGLIYVRHTDGDAPKELLDGNFVRRTDFSTGSHYIYLRIREDTAKNFQNKHCIILVEFLDNYAEGSFDLQYDSEDEKHPLFLYKHADAYPYSGSHKWRWANFNVPDPAFKKRQNANSDFRLRVCPNVYSLKACPDLYIRTVVCISLNN